MRILISGAGVAGPTLAYWLAFASYERQLRGLLIAKQKAARGFARSFLPGSRFGIMRRDLAVRLMAIPKLAEWFMGSMMRDATLLPPFPER